MKAGDTHPLLPSSPASRSQLDQKAKVRLEKATRDFESIFVSYMLKSMRGTSSEGEAFGDSFGGDLMSGMFDQEFAKYVTRGNAFGLGEMMYRNLTGERYPDHTTDPKALKGVTGSSAVQNHEKGTMPKRQVDPGEKQSGPPPVRQEGPPARKEPVPQQQLIPKTEVKHVPVPAISDTVQGRLQEYEEIIQHAAALHGVDSSLVKAVIASESGGRVGAVSGKSAKGLMQLIDSTAADMGVTKIWDPGQNILGGVKYLKQQLDRFQGNVELAAAAYNAGPGAVQKHGGVPPFKETQQYVRRVLDYFSYFQGQEESSDDNR